MIIKLSRVLSLLTLVKSDVSDYSAICINLTELLIIILLQCEVWPGGCVPLLGVASVAGWMSLHFGGGRVDDSE